VTCELSIKDGTVRSLKGIRWFFADVILCDFHSGVLLATTHWRDVVREISDLAIRNVLPFRNGQDFAPAGRFDRFPGSVRPLDVRDVDRVEARVRISYPIGLRQSR
jgi:hypothetical protein